LFILATHAVGKMPLQVELINAEGNRVDKLKKQSNGEIIKPE
jgi:NAD-reducing hydrogenase large subunit